MTNATTYDDWHVLMEATLIPPPERLPALERLELGARDGAESGTCRCPGDCPRHQPALPAVAR